MKYIYDGSQETHRLFFPRQPNCKAYNSDVLYRSSFIPIALGC